MVMKLRLQFLLTIFTLLSALPLQAKVTIHGKVTHGDGDANEPLEFVQVSVKGTAIGCYSDLNGAYSLSAPDADTIAVVFHCIGYHDITRKLIAPKESVTLNATEAASVARSGASISVTLPELSNSMSTPLASSTSYLPLAK